MLGTGKSADVGGNDESVMDGVVELRVGYLRLRGSCKGRGIIWSCRGIEGTWKMRRRRTLCKLLIEREEWGLEGGEGRGEGEGGKGRVFGVVGKDEMNMVDDRRSIG